VGVGLVDDEQLQVVGTAAFEAASDG